MKRLEAQYAAFQIVSLVNRYGSGQVKIYSYKFEKYVKRISEKYFLQFYC